MKKLQISKKSFIISIIVIIFAIILSCFGFYQYQLTATKRDKSVIFMVKANETGNMILDKLHDENLIRNKSMAKIYMKFYHLDQIKAGGFKIEPTWDTRKILKTLNDETKSNSADALVTIKEGMWAKDIANEIEKKTGNDAKELLALWNNETYLKKIMKKYDFLTKDILNDKYKVKLEGYLFPQTYSIPINSSNEKITEVFLNQFQKEIEPFMKDIKKSKYSMQELITYASIVQYEANNIKDMKMIVGLFNNRIKKDMPLGSSATVCYALYDDVKSHVDCEVNPHIDSPYNTYVHKGLPIGPILNPGKDAIDAVLHPIKNDYLYFVSDIYGDGKAYYAKTLEEQEKNIDKFHLRH